MISGIAGSLMWYEWHITLILLLKYIFNQFPLLNIARNFTLDLEKLETLQNLYTIKQNHGIT